MSGLDLGLALFLFTHALLGIRAGFLRGLLGLLGAAGAIALAVVAAPLAAGFLPGWIPWPGAVAGWGTLIVAWVLVPRLTMLMAPPMDGGAGLGNRLLGVVPGLAWGGLGAGTFLWLYATFAGGIPPGNPLAQTLYGITQPSLAAIAATVPGTLPSPPPAPAVQEQAMLGLVNAERKKAGLKPLRWDGALAEVGRKHSADMIAKNYFAHADPAGKTVGDRLKAANLVFLTAGENLAFAPTLPVAHTGLMNSPGHRANILRPGFGRLGVGIVKLPPGASYAPVVEGKPTPRLPMGVGSYLVITQVFAN